MVKAKRLDPPPSGYTKGNILLLYREDKAGSDYELSTVTFQQPSKLRPSNPSVVGTVALVTCRWHVVGHCVQDTSHGQKLDPNAGGGDAEQRECYVTAVDTVSGVVSATDHVYRSDAPRFTTSRYGAKGSAADNQVIDFISKLPNRP